MTLYFVRLIQKKLSHKNSSDMIHGWDKDIISHINKHKNDHSVMFYGASSSHLREFYRSKTLGKLYLHFTLTYILIFIYF